MGAVGRVSHDGPIVLIVDPDPATQLLLEWAADLEGLKPIVVLSAADAYGVLAEDTNQIVLIVLDIARGTDESMAARRLQLDAPRVAQIPAVVLSDRPLTDTERATLRPAISVLKPLQVEEAQEIMRGGRKAAWREGAFIRGLNSGGPRIVLH